MSTPATKWQSKNPSHWRLCVDINQSKNPVLHPRGSVENIRRIPLPLHLLKQCLCLFRRHAPVRPDHLHAHLLHAVRSFPGAACVELSNRRQYGKIWCTTVKRAATCLTLAPSLNNLTMSSRSCQIRLFFTLEMRRMIGVQWLTVERICILQMPLVF